MCFAILPVENLYQQALLNRKGYLESLNTLNDTVFDKGSIERELKIFQENKPEDLSREMAKNISKSTTHIQQLKSDRNWIIAAAVGFVLLISTVAFPVISATLAAAGLGSVLLFGGAIEYYLGAFLVTTIVSSCFMILGAEKQYVLRVSVMNYVKEFMNEKSNSASSKVYNPVLIQASAPPPEEA